jgi:hypothetical protein
MPRENASSIPLVDNPQEGGPLSVGNIRVQIPENIDNNNDSIVIDSVFIFWDVKNAASIILSIQNLDSSLETVGDEQKIDITKLQKYELVLHREYLSRIAIIALDVDGVEVRSGSLDLRKATSNADPSKSIINEDEGFVIEKAGSDYDFNAVKFSLLLDYDENNCNLLNDSLKVSLVYTSDKSKARSVIDMPQSSYKEIKNSDGNLLNYKFNFGLDGKIKINLPQGGNVVFFYLRLIYKNSNRVLDYKSRERFLFFDSTETQTEAATISIDSSSSLPAALRYEIKNKMSEMYLISENKSSEDARSELTSNSFRHYFLDTDRFKGKTTTDLIERFIINAENRFAYLYETSGPGNTKGYIYPACISEILPCINVNLDAKNDNSFITLFWKVVDDFYEYSFFNGEVTIKTTELKVSVEYFDESYKELLSEFLLSSNKNYNQAEQKFFIKIDKNDQAIKDKALFLKIKETDNQNKNLRIVIKSHKVTCSSPFGVYDYSFNKLLIPPQFTHILYDQFLPSSYKNSTTKDFKINLNSPILRGIVLPDAGFKKFDVLNNVVSMNEDKDPVQVTTDYKVFFKLYTEVDAFYLDPIREGTITSIEISSKPDDVFLIAPLVTMPAPNLKTVENGGVQAKAEASLNEYGKIDGIKIIDPGEGYSFFNTLESKRIQTFSDLTPIVKSTYKIVSSNLNKQKSFLTPINSSFSKLKASMDGGSLLFCIDASSRTLDPEQKAILQDYVDRNDISPNQVAEDSRDSLGYNNLKTKIRSSVSVKDLDAEWYLISSLYTEKYSNPLENVSIYNTETDQSAESNDESGISSNVESSSTAIDNAQGISEIKQNNEASGASTTCKTFALNDLLVYTDSSPGITLINNSSAPPWLTIMSKEYRADGAPAYGPLPNMLPRAYNLYNRLSIAVNNLNEVRVMLPMIWAVDSSTKQTDYFLPLPDGQDPNVLLDWSSNGKKQTAQGHYSYYIAINSTVAVNSSRTVRRAFLKNDEKPPEWTEDETYSVSEFIRSSDFESSLSFTPFIHPWMEKAFPEFYLRSYRRKYLGLVSERSGSPSFTAPIQENEAFFINCNGTFGNPYPKAITASSIPVTKESANTYFEFFNNGQISATADGTAQALSFPNGSKGGRKEYCEELSSTYYIKSIDFRYTNMFPGSVRIS